MSKALKKHNYLVPMLSKALDVLEALEAEPATLDELVAKTTVSRSTIYRSLNTFAKRGYIEEGSRGRFSRVHSQQKCSIGILMPGSASAFEHGVLASLEREAAAVGVSILTHRGIEDTRDVREALDDLLAQSVQLIVEFPVAAAAAALIGYLAGQAGIPLIALDYPHPGAIFLGIDQYRGGFESGSQLGLHSLRHWRGHVESVLGLDVTATDPLIKCRTAAAFDAIRSRFPALPRETFVRMDGRDERSSAKARVADYLLHRPRLRHILISAATDSIALGALDAVKEQSAEFEVAISTFDGGPQVAAAIESARSPMIGMTVRNAGLYGVRLMELTSKIIRGVPVDPYNYVDFTYSKKHLPPPSRPLHLDFESHARQSPINASNLL